MSRIDVSGLVSNRGTLLQNGGPSQSQNPNQTPIVPSQNYLPNTTPTSASQNGYQYSVNSDSPAGATVGISGILDGPFTMHTPTNPLRVSFNSAEADLSFPNSLSTEFFSIPDGLEEFLGSTLDPMPNGAGLGLPTASAVNGLLGSGSHSNGMDTVPAFSTLIGPWCGPFQSPVVEIF